MTTTGVAPPYDERKFTELLLYVAKQLEGDPTGAAIKLNKVLFFAEFAHVRAYGRPITGAEYQKLKYGPAPRRLLPVRARLVEGGEARLVEEWYLGYKQDRLVPLREPDLSLLSAEEMKTVHEALGELEGATGIELSELSHEEMGWKMVAEGETIPFEAAYLKPPIISDAIRQHAARLARRRQQ